MPDTGNWKGAERQGSEIFNEFLVPAKRITRADNFSVSTWDISLLDHIIYKIDSKYSKRPFLVNKLLSVIQQKYCKEKKDVPILLTKSYREVGMKATVDLRFLAMLMSYWLGYSDKETLEKIYYKEQ